jgi:hypothetical protein
VVKVTLLVQQVAQPGPQANSRPAVNLAKTRYMSLIILQIHLYLAATPNTMHPNRKGFVLKSTTTSLEPLRRDCFVA